MDDNHVVTVDGHGLFRAWVDPAGDRWNGWLVPSFTRSEVEKVVAWLNSQYALYPDGSDRAEWDGDTVIHHTPMYEGEPGYHPWRVEPDEHGRYWFGAMNWTWYAACQRTAAGWQNATTGELLPRAEVERLGLPALQQ
jgi:hypothetical protein